MQIKTYGIFLAIVTILVSSVPLHCANGGDLPASAAHQHSAPWTRYGAYAGVGIAAAATVAGMGYLAVGLKPTDSLIKSAKTCFGAGCGLAIIFGGLNANSDAEKDASHKQFSTGSAVIGGICLAILGMNEIPSLSTW
jgi:hypothetical protein